MWPKNGWLKNKSNINRIEEAILTYKLPCHMYIGAKVQKRFWSTNQKLEQVQRFSDLTSVLPYRFKIEV